MEQTLKRFEQEIADRFLNKEIRAPVHLSSGNEKQLLSIFEQISDDDWVFSTHRSHFHALLHGWSTEELKKEILDGRSMHLFRLWPKFFSSAIVGGCLPIAVGVALGIKLRRLNQHVWIFIGDMAAEMGAFSESQKYASRNGLPITFVVEDNGLGTDTPTQKVWGEELGISKCIRYSYERGYPHVGVGEWVTF